MSLKDRVKSAVRDLAEDRRDDGAAPQALTLVKGGGAPDGRHLLTEDGAVVLEDGENMVLRADFKRIGVAVLFAKSVTSATRATLFDVEKDADVTITNRRAVIVVDDLSTKGGWSGSGLGIIVAAGANIAHAAASKVRHRGEAAVFEIPLAKINRLLAPSTPVFDWADRRAIDIGWSEHRNIGPGWIRMVLLDQRGETEHLAVARRLAGQVGAGPVGEKVDWRR